MMTTLRLEKFRNHENNSDARRAIAPDGGEENPWHSNLPGGAQYVIALNGRLPQSRNDIDYFVPTEEPLIELKPPVLGDLEKAIGSNVAGLIRDGDCLQLGIGALPDAVLSFLGEKNDLGIHSEMISDGAMSLVEAGVITCKKKTFRPRKAVITFAMGPRQFYQWLDDNALMEAYPVDFTNDPFVIAQNDNMVSINSAISVDLQGQVAADTLGPRQFSGVGGQVDFVRRRQPIQRWPKHHSDAIHCSQREGLPYRGGAG